MAPSHLQLPLQLAAACDNEGLHQRTPSPRGALGIIFGIVFLDLLGVGILIPITPFLVRQFRTDALTVGLLALSFSAAQFLAAPVLGALSDRFGRRPVLIVSLLGSAAGYVLFGVAQTLPLLFAARIIDGITGGNISTAQAYLADITPEQDRARSFGLIGAAFGLGFILGPAISGGLSHFSIAAPAFFAAGLSLLTCLLTVLFLPESLPPERRQSTAGAGLPLALFNPFTPITSAFRNPALRPLLNAGFAVNFASAALQSNFAVYTLERFRFGPTQNAFIFAYIGAITTLVQGVLIRRMVRSVGEERLALNGVFLQIAGFLWVAFAHSTWALYAASGLVSVGGGMFTPVLISLLSKRVSPREQGALLGTTQSMASLTRVLGPVWAGAAFDYVGSGSPYWTGAIFLALGAALVVQATRPVTPTPAPAP